MLHTLTRAFRIPLLALIGLVTLWLAMSNSPAQAHATQSITHATTTLGARPVDNKPQNNLTLESARFTALQSARPAMIQAAEPVTYTIYPLPRQRLRGLFDDKDVVVSGQGASIFFTKTVGTEIDDCFASTTHELVVEPTTTVTYCYIVVNTGSITLTHHTITDDQLGTLLADYPYILTPYGTDEDAAFIPVTSLITKTSASNATWTAKQDVVVASASDATLVIVPTIELRSTVVANSTTCNGGKKSLRVSLNTPLLYCYALKNTSPITLSVQTVVDSSLGTLIDKLKQPLPAGGAFTLTHTVAAMHSSTSVVTWTSGTEDGVQVSASDIVTVQVPASIVLSARANMTNDACSGPTSLTVDYGSSVIFCYLIRNNGGTALQQHQISDALNGTYDAFTRTVEVDHLLAVTLTKVITENIVNTVTWRASSSNGDEIKSEAAITVTVIPPTVAEFFIYRDTNHNDQPDPGEIGIPQVVITLTSPSGDVFSATTNAKGVAIFAPLPEAGNYTIEIDQSSLPPNSVPSDMPEEITLIKAEHITKSIGYQQAISVDQKVYLPTIAR